MTIAADHLRPLAGPDRDRLETMVEQFEAAWERGERLTLDAFLPAAGDLRLALLVELALSDLEYRLRAGEPARADNYLDRYAELRAVPGAEGELRAVEGRRRAQPTGELGPADRGEAPTVSGYEVLGELGRGGMGVVYKARQIAADRIVALKMIRVDGPADADLAARFRTEAAAAARLQHPHIVQIFDVGEAGGRPYFAMELVAGGTLADRVAAGPLPPAAAAAVLLPLARAVAAAHARGVLHRDLKPGNVLLTADGTPKIADFGLAKRLDRDSDQTRTGAVVGTPGFMAPEQAAGPSRELTPAADVYALGATLYACLTGRPPFQAATVLETLDQVRSCDPVPPRQLQPKVPRDLETICLKCLRKEPGRRYASAAALADDLERYRTGRPIAARPLGLAARTVRWCRRNPALSAAAGVAATALVGAVGVSAWFAAYQYRTAETLRGLNRRANQITAGLAIDRGVSLCADRAVADGLLWLSRGLELADQAGDDGLAAAARANLAAWADHIHPLTACLEHPGPVLSVAVLDGGARLVTGCADGGVRVWDVGAGTQIGGGLHLPGPVGALAVTGDGAAVLTGCGDGTAQLWDAVTWKPAGPPLRHGGSVLAVACGRDGRTVVTGTAAGGQVWDAVAGTPRGPPLMPGQSVGALAVLADGRAVALGCGDGTVRAWRLDTGEPAGPVVQLPAGVIRLAALPGGRRVLTGDEDWDAAVWDLDAGRRDVLLPFNQGQVAAVAVHPDGTIALTGCADSGTAQLWDLATAKPIGIPLSHQGPVSAAALGGPWAVTAGADGTARVWRVSSPPTPRRLAHGGHVRAIAFRPDGRLAAVGDDAGVVRLWDPAAGTPVGRPMPHPAPLRAAAFRADGRVLLTAAADDRVRAWDAATGEPAADAPPAVLGENPNLTPASVTFGPDGRWLLGPAESKAVARLWDAATGRAVGGRWVHPAEVMCTAISPDGRTAVTGCADGTVHAWEVPAGRPLIRFPVGHEGNVLSATVSPDGRLALTGGKDNVARIWDVATGRPVGAPLLHPHGVWGVAFAPDGRLAATACHDGRVRLWAVPPGKPVGPPVRHGDSVLRVVFSPNGRSLLAGGWDGAATVWPVPPAVTGDVAQVRAWAEGLAVRELDESGAIHLLSPADWAARRP